jgi:hypothetical protein
MTRFKPLRDWPDRLKRMTVEELRKELAFWESRLAWLGHPVAKKETAKRIREVQREIDARQASDD